MTPETLAKPPVKPSSKPSFLGNFASEIPPIIQPIIGWKEWCCLESLGLKAIKGKIDTGAKTSSLHAFNIETYFVGEDEFVRFQIHPLQKNKKLVQRCFAKILERRMVCDSGGKKERRIVIETCLQIGQFSQKIELTLTNRDSMNFRMLLGREAIKKGGFIVDVSKAFLQGKRRKIRTKKAKNLPEKLDGR